MGIEDQRTPNIYAVQLPTSPDRVQVIRAMSATMARRLIDVVEGQIVSVSKIGPASTDKVEVPEIIAEIPFRAVSQHFEV